MATFTTTPGHFTRQEDGGYSIGLFHENGEGTAFVDSMVVRTRLTAEGACSRCGQPFYVGADEALVDEWKRHYPHSHHRLA